MKKVLTLSALVAVSVFMAQCSSTKTVAKSEASPTAMVAEAKKNYTPAQMEQGKTIWQGSCQKCHKLYEPQSRSVSKWNSVLPRMSSRAHLSADDAAMVRAYLIANAVDIS